MLFFSFSVVFLFCDGVTITCLFPQFVEGKLQLARQINQGVLRGISRKRAFSEPSIQWKRGKWLSNCFIVYLLYKMCTRIQGGPNLCSYKLLSPF